jgi:hypothetical protein
MAEGLFNLGVMNVSFGVDNTFMGMRNIVIGNDNKVYGDYHVVVSNKVTVPTYNNNEERDRMIAIHVEMLKVYHDLNQNKVCPEGFYEKAEMAIRMICALIEGSKTPEEPKEEEPSTMKKTEAPKVEEVK